MAGDFARPPDEGMRRTAQELARALAPHAPVHRFDLGQVARWSSWRALRAFAPDAALYVPGPSWRSLALLRAMKRATGAKLGACLTLNPEGLGPGWMAKGLRPDLVFVHSESTARRFAALGVPHHPLRLGVDAARFRPATPKERAAARAGLGLPSEGKVLLHVGHLKEGRNLRALTDLTGVGTVLVLGSTATPADSALVSHLESRGVRVVRAYLPDPGVVYRAADAYVFPVVEAHNATEIPLSILEALASGLPVVTTPYGGVPGLLADCAAARVVEPDGIQAAAEEVLSAGLGEAARQAGLAFGWDGTAREVLRILKEAAA